MKIFTKLLFTLALTLVGLGGAKAQDYQINERKTSVSAGDVVAIVNENDGTGKAFYINKDGGNGLSYDVYSNAFLNSNDAIYFKIVSLADDGDASVHDYYYLVSVKPNGEVHYVYGSPGYLNSQPAEEGKWCCFVQWNANGDIHHGQDLNYGAVWDIQYSSENGGFSIKNIGTGKYLKDASPARYDDPTYFSLCTLLDTEYNLTANHVLNISNGSAGTNIWDKSTTYTLTSPMEANKTYVIEAYVNAVNGGAVQLCSKVASGEGSRAKYSGAKGVLKNVFTKISWEFTPGAYDPEDLYTQIEFQMGGIAGEIYIDNVSCKEKDTDNDLVANGDFEVPNSTEGWTIPSWTGQSIHHAEKELSDVEENPTVLVTVGEAGYMTFITGTKFEVDEDDAKVYIARYVKPTVKLTSVSVIPAWNPVIIEASQGVHVFRSTTADPDDFSSNQLILQWSPVTQTDGTLYALAKKNDVVGFYRVADGESVPAGKAYLVISDPPADSREFVGFGYGNETTDINTVQGLERKADGYYNLAGQRVAQPTKGLYIVNGKKVIIK